MRNPRHILITGASSGLGAALALDYAAPGIRLSLHGRNAERLAQIAEWARKRGADVFPSTGDVIEAAALEQWIATCDKESEIDLVIANAGISVGTSDGYESLEQIRTIFAVNVHGVFTTVQAILPAMLRRRHGQIALVSSLAGFRGFPGAPAYCASKAAIRIYGEGLRGVAAEDNVAINVICPGFIKTPMTDRNRFPMPFLMGAERAAILVRQGLAANHARIAFPWQMYLLTRLIASLPQTLMDLMAAHIPKK
jgi:NADP-dependent 3-hydroxy acid dehydrogenase YdfG